MNRNQIEDRPNEAKGKAQSGNDSGDKSKQHKGEVEKHGGKDGAVLGEINRDAKKGKK